MAKDKQENKQYLRSRKIIHDDTCNSAVVDVSAGKRIEQILSDPKTKKSPAKIIKLAELYKIFRLR